MATSIVLLSLTALGVQRAFGAQIPFFIEDSPLIWRLDTTWDFNQRPPANATGNFVFQSVGSLLQHWPNTLYRNGHTVVPGTVPSGTLLYHGAHAHEMPHGPSWVATDPEHANIFCSGGDGQGCWQLTLMATRPLKVLYFDGSSAAKMLDGTLDSQDIVAWGRTRPECLFNEGQRIHDLCKWGRNYDLDGFVRMEMDFEIMLCDFSKGIQVVSSLNLPAEGPPPFPTSLPPLPKIPDPNPTGGCPPPPPLPSPFPKLPPPPPVSETFLRKVFLVTESGSWHRRYPGDSRVQLDLARLVSFYDTNIFPSLVSERIGKPKWAHRLESVSKGDIEAMYRRLDEVLSPQKRGSGGSGVDWQAVIRIIMKRYGERLEVLQYVLRGTNSSAVRGAAEIVFEARKQTTAMLVPYITRGALPQIGTNLSWAIPVFKECATTYVDSLRAGFHSQMTRSERLILNSIRDTVKEICRVVVRIWAETSVSELSISDSRQHEVKDLSGAVKRWEEDVSGLMNWLAWDIWTTCRPACGFEEICYLPTWPFFYRDPRQPLEKWDPDNPPRPPQVDGLPKPFCIGRLPPYKLNLEVYSNMPTSLTSNDGTK